LNGTRVPGGAPRVALFTVGHSTRALADLIELLLANGVRRLVDIRTRPRSARHPHFNREALPPPLAGRGLAYTHMGSLGGLRVPRGDSTNLALRADGFRGFADYMETAAFEAALDELVALAARTRVAIMCAEADPSRCHRSLVADALLARCVNAVHILAPDMTRSHTLTAGARIENGRVSYPRPQPRLPGIP
jgi:uncharacterized protein (DUF488 family)